MRPRLATRPVRVRPAVEPLEGPEMPANFTAGTGGELVAAMNAAKVQKRLKTLKPLDVKLKAAKPAGEKDPDGEKK